MTAERLPIGHLLDSLGVKASLEATDMVTGAVLVLRLVSLEGRVGLAIERSEGMSWLDLGGMLDAANKIHDSHYIAYYVMGTDDDDDDIDDVP